MTHVQVDKSCIRSVNNNSNLQKCYIVSHSSGFKGVITKCNSDGTYEVWSMDNKGIEQWNLHDVIYDDIGNQNYNNEKLIVGSVCDGTLFSTNSLTYLLIIVTISFKVIPIGMQTGSLEKL